MLGRKTGFTLIELLVVIAIIAILASILFPVFLAAKAKAHQTACAGNMKQISDALYLYLGDNNETFPPNRIRDPLMGTGVKLNGTRFNWKLSILPYIKNKEDVWRCRANRNSDSLDETATGPGIPAAVTAASVRFPISYAYNGDYFNQFEGSDDKNPPKPMKLSQIGRPTRLILICESVMDTPDIHPDFATQYWAAYPDYSTGKTVTGCRITLHSGGVSNFVFADTHARSMKLRPTFVPVSMWYPGCQAYYDDIANRLADDAR